MPKNKGLGGKKRSRQKTDCVSREMVYKDNGTEYAQIEKDYGNGRIALLCENQSNILGIIRGSVSRKIRRPPPGSIVLISRRDFEEDKADIVYLYNQNEIKLLRSQQAINFAEERVQANDDEGAASIEFCEEIDDDEIDNL